MPHRRGLILAVVLTAALAVSRLFPAPALVDASAAAAVPARLVFPLGHLLLTPFASLADVFSCAGARQDISLGLLLLAGLGPFRFFVLGHGPGAWFDRHDAVVGILIYLPLLAAFVAWALLWPHAPPRLVLDDPDALAVDFHSHTSFSWDGRRSFTPRRNAAWHRAAGFGAGFVTDHNTVAGRAAAAPPADGYASLDGEEVSLHDAHVVVLGNAELLEPSRWADSEQGAADFLSDAARRKTGLTVLSLPEYRQHDWGEPLERLGALSNGLEILTSSPKAMDLSEADRGAAVDLCRRKNLFMAGATDNHGWASCACVWNVLRVPGWRSLEPRALQAAVLGALKGGFGAVRVVARARVDEGRGDAVLLDGPRSLWLMLRAWTPLQCLAAAAWAWIFAFAFPLSHPRPK